MALREDDVDLIRRRVVLALANSNPVILESVLEGRQVDEDTRRLVLSLANAVQTIAADLEYVLVDRYDLMDVIDALGADVIDNIGGPHDSGETTTSE